MPDHFPESFSLLLDSFSMAMLILCDDFSLSQYEPSPGYDICYMA